MKYRTCTQTIFSALAVIAVERTHDRQADVSGSESEGNKRAWREKKNRVRNDYEMVFDHLNHIDLIGEFTFF